MRVCNYFRYEHLSFYRQILNATLGSKKGNREFHTMTGMTSVVLETGLRGGRRSGLRDGCHDELTHPWSNVLDSQYSMDNEAFKQLPSYHFTQGAVMPMGQLAVAWSGAWPDHPESNQQERMPPTQLHPAKMLCSHGLGVSAPSPQQASALRPACTYMYEPIYEVCVPSSIRHIQYLPHLKGLSRTKDADAECSKQPGLSQCWVGNARVT